MDNFNSKEYAWVDLVLVMMGKPVAGIRAVAYKTTVQQEALYAAGKYPRSIQKGKIGYEGTLTLLQSEVIQLHYAAKAKGHDSLCDIEFDAVVSYAPEGGVITTDVIKNISISEASYDIKVDDLYQEVALPFLALGVEYNKL